MRARPGSSRHALRSPAGRMRTRSEAPRHAAPGEAEAPGVARRQGTPGPRQKPPADREQVTSLTWTVPARPAPSKGPPRPPPAAPTTFAAATAAATATLTAPRATAAPRAPDKMFSSHFLLSKRGPLAKIWLAAHLEGKLTKAQVFECNIEATIEKILSPKVKLALRTAGHLLLGLVRIYSRKAKYLVTDCNEAFLKIKMSFRPDLVDLPLGNLEASYSAITLPEEFHDFDAPPPTLSDISVIEHFSLNQSRAEDITLKEEWRAEASFFDESVLSAPSQLLEPSPASPRDDREPAYACGDGFGDEGSKGQMIDNLLQGDDYSLFTEDLNPDQQLSLPPTPVDVTMESDPDPAAAAGGRWEERSSPVPGAEGAFTLEPVEATARRGKRRMKKRVLLVDSVKEISRPLFRSQILAFDDTLSDTCLAPPTRNLMEWMDTGSLETLFSRPAQRVISAELEALFTSILSRSLKIEKRGERVTSEATEARSQSGIAPASREHSVSWSPVSRKTRRDGMEPPRPPAEGDEMEDGPENPDFGPAAIETTVPSTPEGLRGDVFSDEEFESHSVELDRLLTDEADEGKEEEEGEGAFWNKAIQLMLSSLRQSFKDGASQFNFLHLSWHQDRKRAAVNFYSFLILRKHQAIQLSQKDPYGDIIVSVGPMFAELWAPLGSRLAPRPPPTAHPPQAPQKRSESGSPQPPDPPDPTDHRNGDSPKTF
ncbi:double-strand-break repair protein rad21-like protein 1 [Tachyglossus aculeatus]|uniref:double-strand-break repair protein rad21-like protein 1 n=1 Tax=Tachyglossus aculeatus TaxID=9261 RepID=UPI0018F45741|nr:double-strand-break repair protein rad21-like protein 1 [Tachyglossus aculeatus]